MNGQEFHIEVNAKKSLAIKDFNLLSTPGILGDYKECEITHIFLVENNTRKLLHYYAVLSFEELLELDNEFKCKYLTEKLIVINKDYKLGIKRNRLICPEASRIFEQLCLYNLEINGTPFIISRLFTLFPKTHIPSLWGNDASLLTKILKPNFWGDNYIIEFFSNQNPFEGLLSEKDIFKINMEIKNTTGIDLGIVNDRIGSFIFQFPVTLVQAKASPSNDWCNAKLSVKTYIPFNQDHNITSIISTHFDDIITGYNSFDGPCNELLLEIGDSRDFEFMVINKQNKLIYHHFKGSFTKYFNIGGNIGIHNSEPRIFKNSNNKEVRVDLFHNTFSVNKTSEMDYDERIIKRMEHNKILKTSNQFRIFNKQRDEALNYVRTLLKMYTSESSEIWIVDPYLRSQDILDTLYYIDLLDIKLKCITSYRKSKFLNNEQEIEARKFYQPNNKKSHEFEEFKSEQKEWLLNNSNNLGINLEFRITYDIFGFDFHDRFLFFIPKDISSYPTVYSLGTSINSLGNAHHIIQRSPDPRELVSTFRDLWNLLVDASACIIKLPENTKK
jgi:hypothetical protein